uniref:Epidermal growth factor receptor substrate 15-like 1 n=1 Tax=Cacopsylla melanoneura TaxID=428564 RepID=A0A8D8QW53_9HEMI
MPSLPPPQQVAGRHLPLFEAYYKDLDPKDTNNIGALNAAKFLKNSGLSDVLLSKIWDLSDPNGTGFLTKAGLFTALKLVALAQNNVDVSVSNIGRDVPPPMMGDATAFPPNIPPAPSPLPLSSAPAPNPPLISSIPVVPVDWSMSPMERLKYETLFESLQPVNGYIPGNKVKGVLMDSKLPTDTLGKIWDLADMDKDGCLDRHEFIVAMHLVYKALEKFAIPATLPPELLPPAKRKTVEKLKSSAPPALPPAPVPWVVSKEDQARYETMFTRADQDMDGFVNGPEIKHVFLSANLPQHVLANIWSLADIQQAGKLNKEQFCLALWLVQRKLQGNELPSSLTPEMVPPSMRGPAAAGAGGATAAPAPQQPPPPPSNPEMDMISKDIAELSGERTHLENDIAGKQADITIKSGEIKSLQGELDALAATLRQLENQKVEAAKRLGDLKLQTGGIQSELSEVDGEIEAEQAQVDKLRTQATDQESILSRQEQELSSKKQELDGLKHEEHELEKKQRDLTKKVIGLTAGLEETQELITKVKGKVTCLETLQRNMTSLISLSEEAVAEPKTISSIPDALLSLEPEFKTEPYTSLIRDNTKQTDAFATSNGFDTDPFAATGTNSQSDPFAAAFNSNGPHDPFADTAPEPGPADSRFTKDPFGCDPFAAGGATSPAPHHPPAGGATLGAAAGGPPPRPESPSPALPPKKSKQPPPRPAPPRPLAPTQPVASTTTAPAQEFANFDNFNTKVKSQQVSSPFSPTSAYGSSTSSLLSPPHSSLKSPPSPSSSSPAAASTTSVIGCPTSITSQSVRLVIQRTRFRSTPEAKYFSG